MSVIDLSNEWNLSPPERERLRQEKMRFLHRIRDERELRMTGSSHEDVDAAVNTIIQATIEQINNFDIELQNYETMTVAEIMEIRAVIDQLLDERVQLLNNAHTLADGTHVFKTEDGNRVYDEYGELVSENVVHPDDISNDRTKWKAYQKNMNALNYQNRNLEVELDNLENTRDQRDELAAGGISADRLGELRRQHNARKSDAIRIKEANINPDQLPAKPTQQFAMAAQDSTTNSVTLEMNVPGLGG